MKRYKTVDAFLEGAESWQDELGRLREILVSTGLQETVKWGAPTYTHAGKNVVGIGGFKSYFGLWFYQGALLDDSKDVLINAQEGKTKAMRQWRMTSAKEIKVGTIKSYVKQAMKLAEEGKEIKPDVGKPVSVPDELQAALKKNRKANAEFKKMTMGKQREYANYVSEAKRDATKLSRVEKILPMICDGKGLNDKYRNC